MIRIFRLYLYVYLVVHNMMHTLADTERSTRLRSLKRVFVLSDTRVTVISLYPIDIPSRGF